MCIVDVTRGVNESSRDRACKAWLEREENLARARAQNIKTELSSAGSSIGSFEVDYQMFN